MTLVFWQRNIISRSSVILLLQSHGDINSADLFISFRYGSSTLPTDLTDCSGDYADAEELRAPGFWVIKTINLELTLKGNTW